MNTLYPTQCTSADSPPFQFSADVSIDHCRTHGTPASRAVRAREREGGREKETYSCVLYWLPGTVCSRRRCAVKLPLPSSPNCSVCVYQGVSSRPVCLAVPIQLLLLPFPLRRFARSRSRVPDDAAFFLVRCTRSRTHIPPSPLYTPASCVKKRRLGALQRVGARLRVKSTSATTTREAVANGQDDFHASPSDCTTAC